MPTKSFCGILKCLFPKLPQCDFFIKNSIKHFVILNPIKALNILSTRAALISICVAVLHMEGKSVLTHQLGFDFAFILQHLDCWPKWQTISNHVCSSTVTLGKQVVVYLE